MRIADDSVCYRIAISDCVKEPNSLMAVTPFKKTGQCSICKDQFMFISAISPCGKGMFWTVVLHFAVSDAKHRTVEECLLLQSGDHSVWESFSLEHCTEAAQGGKKSTMET